MDTSYRFTSDIEPTPQQLDELMTEVIKDVKTRAKIGELRAKDIQKKYLSAVLKHQLAKHKK